MRITGIVALFLLLGIAAVGRAQSQPAASPTATPTPAATEISADRGPCSAEFHVTDLVGKPIYDAMVRTTVRWGLGHRLDLQAATNAGGRVRFIRLPATVKKPLQFEVRYQDQSISYSIDPGTDCHADRDVPLKVTVPTK